MEIEIQITEKELKKMGYYGLDYEASEQDIRIGKILGKIDKEVSDRSLKKYFICLKKFLKFPFEAIGQDDQYGRKFSVFGIHHEEGHESYGLFAETKNLKTAELLHVPLCDLEVKRKKDINYQLVDDYSVWFVNNR